jgi:hypothetical protein
MHKRLVISLMAIVLAFWFITPAVAGGEEFTAQIESMVVATGSNGQEYVRFILPMTKKTSSGIEYPDSFAFMAFGNLVEEAKKYKEGDQLTVIATMRLYQGSESYTIKKFLPTKTASQ